MKYEIVDSCSTDKEKRIRLKLVNDGDGEVSVRLVENDGKLGKYVVIFSREGELKLGTRLQGSGFITDNRGRIEIEGYSRA